MPQVRKPDVERRIHDAALHHFAHDGLEATSMVAIAGSAGVSTGNLYRYHPDGKRALLARVLPASLADRFDQLVTDRVRALPLGSGVAAAPPPEADELLDFWIAHRLEVVILLARAEDTPYADYPGRFEHLLVDLAVERLRQDGTEPTDDDRTLLSILMANTRTALAEILLRFEDAPRIREAVAAFWSYQLPGLEGLYARLTAARQGPGLGEAACGPVSPTSIPRSCRSPHTE